MAKIMLVEDDNNLREIYEARLLAEGYEIVSAEDGEQALAMAVKEKPDLIISDVMMPKISGFDMLDILRSTPETRNTKVIMMTALSQAEDKTRADKLGADRYLVKSQVTLEDVAKVAREVLQGEDGPTPSVAASPTPVASVTPAPAPTADDSTTASPVIPEPAVAVAPEPTAASPAPAPAPVAAEPPQNAAPATPDPVVTPQPAPEPASDAAVTPAVAATQPDTTAEEEKVVEEQINTFVANIPAEQPVAAESTALNPEPAVAVAPEPTAASPAPAPVVASPDAQNAAAENATNMTEAANELLDKTADAVADPAPTSNNKISGKKVIAPINDVSGNFGPNLNDLLAKEEQTIGVAPAPATSIVSPGGEVVTPPPGESDEGDAQSDGVNPNNIAL